MPVVKLLLKYLRLYAWVWRFPVAGTTFWQGLGPANSGCTTGGTNAHACRRSLFTAPGIHLFLSAATPSTFLPSLLADPEKIPSSRRTPTACWLTQHLPLRCFSIAVLNSSVLCEYT